MLKIKMNEISASLNYQVLVFFLAHLDLSNDFLDKKLSSYIGILFELSKLDLSNNRIHGSLPNELFDASRLKYVKISINTLDR